MYAIIDSRAPTALLEALEGRGFTLVPVPVHPSIDPPIASHADLQLYIDRETAICSNLLRDAYADQELVFLKEAIAPEQEPTSPYPHDSPLNLVCMDGRLICNARTVPVEILERIGKKPLSVHQGYTKCSVLPISERSFITEDMGICRAATKEGYDVLLIRKGFVALPGFPYGFIGGAASYAPRRSLDEIYFCGEITRHPDWDRIRTFCKQYKREPISLMTAPLMDVGTVFLID